MTVYHSETLALVIHALVPLSTQVSPSQPGPGPHRGGVGAGLPLGQAVADHRLARGDRGEHLLLEVLRRRQDDRHRAELVDRRDQRGADVDPGHLLDHDAGGDRVGTLAAVGLGDVGGVEARPRSSAFCASTGYRESASTSAANGRDLPLGDVPDRLPDRLVLVGQRVQPERCYPRVDGKPPSGPRAPHPRRRARSCSAASRASTESARSAWKRLDRRAQPLVARRPGSGRRAGRRCGRRRCRRSPPAPRRASARSTAGCPGRRAGPAAAGRRSPAAAWPRRPCRAGGPLPRRRR